ncbi:MAG: imidazolonepropionase-like amidohydrolase [Planctomycetota bacterium]|jgi:imidazolonepropionase-like amidohydrolase
MVPTKRTMTHKLLAMPMTAVLLTTLATAAPFVGAVEVESPRTIYVDAAYLAPGEAMEGALITIENGKITAIAPAKGKPGDDAIHAAALTAGMIDASVRINSGLTSVEQSTEVQPHRRAADSLDLWDPRWERNLKSGVTTVLANPIDQNVIGGLGVVLKTGGAMTLEARTVRADAVVRGAIGTRPSAQNHAPRGRPTDFYTRRPTTRMGVEWVWRKAFYDAESAPRVPENDFEGSQILRDVLAGKRVLCIEAWTTQDIRTAIFLKEEMRREGFGEISLMIDAGAEAWREPDMVARAEASVVLPPFSHFGRTTDGAFFSWNVARELLDRGVPVALSSHGARSVSDRLAQQAGYAMRGGLSFDEALAAVTTAPASMLGVEDRVGSVAVGKDADLVLWSGTPFAPTSSVVGVLLDGKLVLDPR